MRQSSIRGLSSSSGRRASVTPSPGLQTCRGSASTEMGGSFGRTPPSWEARSGPGSWLGARGSSSAGGCPSSGVRSASSTCEQRRASRVRSASPSSTPRAASAAGRVQLARCRTSNSNTSSSGTASRPRPASVTRPASSSSWRCSSRARRGRIVWSLPRASSVRATGGPPASMPTAPSRSSRSRSARARARVSSRRRTTPRRTAWTIGTSRASAAQGRRPGRRRSNATAAGQHSPAAIGIRYRTWSFWLVRKKAPQSRVNPVAGMQARERSAGRSPSSAKSSRTGS